MVFIIINQNRGTGNTTLNMKKLNKNTQLTILIVTLFCIIIFLIITKINSTNNSNPTNSTNSSSSSPNNNIQNNESFSDQTTSNPNYIGETNSNGDKIYYESDSDEEFNGSEPLPPRIFITPTTSPNQDSEDQPEDIDDISLDFPMERYLPYQGRYFRIEKYYDVNNLEVLVSDKSQTNLAKEEVKQWLIDQGDDQYDKFTIVYR